jgi:TolB protein
VNARKPVSLVQFVLRGTLHPVAALVGLPLALTGLVAASPTLAGDIEQVAGTIMVDVHRHGATKTPIALPEPAGDDPSEAEFYAVLKRDLEICGWFDVINPDAYIEGDGAGVRPGSFKFEDWEVPGAVGLAKTGLRGSGSDLRTEVWIYDVPGRRKLGARAFSTGGGAARTLAHKVANEIIHTLTGTDGPFNTRFVAAGSFSGNKEIYVLDFDGANRTRVTKNGTINIQPTWDSAGSRVAFTSYMSGNPDVYVADLGKGRIRRVSARPGLNTGPAWHPSGGRLAVTLSRNGDPDIFALDPNTGASLGQLTRSAGIDTSAAFSNGGDRIAFVSERSGGAQIYVANADGSGARRVTFQGGHNTDPAWSPDDKSIAFVGRDGVFDVFTVDVETGRMTRITQSAGDNEDPSWSPDGRFLAFSSTRSGGSHIWMATANGAHQVQLTSGSGGYTNPDWSPALPW